MRTLLVVTIGVPLFVFACGGGERGSSGETPGQDAAAGQDAPSPGGDAGGPTGSASIKGTVKLTGQAPQNPTIDMGEEPQCREHYSSPPRDPVVVVSGDGGLANVFVYVKAGLPQGARYTAPTSAVVLDQEGCLYHPRVFGVVTGQKIEIQNSDPLLHNIKSRPTANRPFNISQPTSGMKTERTFSSSEVMVPFECNVHGWMKAYAGVLPHPFFATTGDDGSFTIGNLPAGTYTVEIWHEKFGTKTAEVVVAESETKTADFNYSSR